MYAALGMQQSAGEARSEGICGEGIYQTGALLVVEFGTIAIDYDLVTP